MATLTAATPFIFTVAADHVIIEDNEAFHIEDAITQAAWVKLDNLPGAHCVIFRHGAPAEGGRNIGLRIRNERIQTPSRYGQTAANGGFRDINYNNPNIPVDDVGAYRLHAHDRQQRDGDDLREQRDENMSRNRTTLSRRRRPPAPFRLEHGAGSGACWPLTVMRPSATISSTARRLATPAAARTFWIRSASLTLAAVPTPGGSRPRAPNPASDGSRPSGWSPAPRSLRGRARSPPAAAGRVESRGRGAPRTRG